MDGPVVIGGVGGSGTRLVAQLAAQLGVFIGGNLNFAHDNLDFPMMRRGANWAHIGTKRAGAFFDTMREGQARAGSARWGWKYPASFLALHELSQYVEVIDYVHVIRNGFYMVTSKNHNQVRKWGSLFHVEYGKPTVPRSALEYWIRANEYALSTARALPNCRLHLIRYEDLCRSPLAGVLSLRRFLNVADDDHRDVARIASLVAQRPAWSYQEGWLDQFASEEIAGAARLGYPATVGGVRRL